MKNSEYIEIIDQAFEDMKTRKETSIIVRLFENVTQFTLPSGGILQTNFAKIILVRIYDQNVIKVLYRKNNTYEPLMFMEQGDKHATVECLRMNEILPSAEEFINAHSLLNSLSCAAVENLFHCGFTHKKDLLVRYLRTNFFNNQGFFIPLSAG